MKTRKFKNVSGVDQYFMPWCESSDPKEDVKFGRGPERWNHRG